MFKAFNGCTLLAALEFVVVLLIGIGVGLWLPDPKVGCEPINEGEHAVFTRITEHRYQCVVWSDGGYGKKPTLLSAEVIER